MHRSFLLLLCLANLALLISATPIDVATPSTVGAVYFLTNDAAGNNVMMHTIDANGTLAYGDYVSTGGKGAHRNPGQTPPLGDALNSQGSVLVHGNHLYVVNAGSNTVTMFSINPRNPTQLTMVGKPVASGGDFPMSLDVSLTTGNVCVLNGGTATSVQCFHSTLGGLFPIPSSHVLIPNVNQTNPPTGPPNTLSQIMFSPDGSKLLVSWKGIPANQTSGTAAIPGWISAWNVLPNGGLSSTFTRTTTPTGGFTAFSMTPIPTKNRRQLAVLNTDPATGFVIYDFSQSPVVATPYTIPGQKATCWSEYSKSTGTFWLSDGKTGGIYEVAVDPDTLVARVVKEYPQNSDPSVEMDLLDEAIVTIGGKDYLFVLNATQTSILVMRLNRAGDAETIQEMSFGEVQFAGGSPVAVGANVQGMAAYMM